jgi:hypothetical protein
MPDAIDPSSRIEELLNSAEPRIARAFRAAIAQLGDELDLDQIEEMLNRGDLESALRYTQTVAERVGDASLVTFISSGQDTARFLSGLDLGTIAFNQINVRAVAALQNNNLRLITEFTAEQRQATRLALLDGISRGLNPRDQARNFRDSVGLTERQQAAVINYRRLLSGSADEQREALSRELRDKRHDRSVERSISTGAPLSTEQVDKMVERYRQRYIKYRSEVIGRTEALRAVHEGVNEGYEQAIESGKLDRTQLERTWDSSKDGRVRNTHRSLDGQARNWGETWQTANGVLRYPGDPQAPAVETVQCRCLLVTRIKGALKSVRKYLILKRANANEEVWAMAA